MRNMLISSAIALFCAAAIPAAAQANISPANQDSAQSGDPTERTATQRPQARDPNRRICVSDRLSDSRMRRRICRTQAEWDSLQANDENSLNR
jgi:hypothetical protein